jgi:hypothetical protein
VEPSFIDEIPNGMSKARTKTGDDGKHRNLIKWQTRPGNLIKWQIRLETWKSDQVANMTGNMEI